MVYTDVISNNVCPPQMVLSNTDITHTSNELYSLIEKAYISEVLAGNVQFIFENNIEIELIEIIIDDESGNHVYRDVLPTKSGFNSFIINIEYLEPGNYLFNVNDEHQRELLRKKIQVESQ